MNTKEIGEIRRRVRRDRSNMTAIFGCYVNEQGEIVSEFRQSTAMMSENEADKYFGLLRRTLSGTPGKNLIDIRFQTAQVAQGEEQRLLRELRDTRLEEEALRAQFFRSIIESSALEGSYLILAGCDSYDVPFRSRDQAEQPDASEETYSYLLCAVCPVKQTKPTLHYEPQSGVFHDGGITNVVSAPEIGFLYPAFDDRATNLYGALYYTHSQKDSRAAFANAVFRTDVPMPAAEQKHTFESLLTASLEEECTLEVVQTVHDSLCQRIELHRESKVPEPLLISGAEVREALSACGVSEARLAKFGVDFEETFGMDAEVHPKNLIDHRHFEIHTPDVAIRVDPARSDLIETRVIGEIKYLLIPAEEDVEVNGVSIHIDAEEPAPV